jgi:hypothetical protein
MVEQFALARAQHLVAPCDGRFQRALARQRGPGTAGQQREAIVQVRAQVFQRQGRCPGCGQLDR